MELWNATALLKQVFGNIAEQSSYGMEDPTEDNFLSALWVRQFKFARDERPYNSDVWSQVKTRILKAQWFDVLDLIEAVVKHLGLQQTARTENLQGHLLEAFNNIFERCLVSYRFIGTEVTPIDSSVEGAAVDTALSDSNTIAGARHSLERAVELLADRRDPDYPNSIKESISAVEAVTKRLTGEGTLGTGLSKLEANGLKIHPALRSAWSKMYGWTSDEDGIRHGGIDAADATQTLAKYVLVTCAAFTSYLIEEGRKAQLI